jgi:TATA-binding protein-associated factor Taf7
MEMAKENVECNITNIKGPFVNIKINCKCYDGNGRMLSIMAIAGIVNSMNSENRGNCPLCKDIIKISFLKNKPQRKNIMDFIYDEIDVAPEEFEIKEQTFDGMSNDAKDFMDSLVDKDECSNGDHYYHNFLNTTATYLAGGSDSDEVEEEEEEEEEEEDEDSD